MFAMLAAAAPTVKQDLSGVATKAWQSVVGSIDPGKARDRRREAEAEYYYQQALQGSVTAARYLYWAKDNKYTIKEKGYSRDRWNKLQGSAPQIANQAVQLGGLPMPDNPSADQLTAMQQEIQDWTNSVRSATSTFVANVAAGAGTQAASAIAPKGSAESGTVLIPTDMRTVTLIVAAIVLVAFVLWKRH